VATGAVVAPVVASGAVVAPLLEHAAATIAITANAPNMRFVLPIPALIVRSSSVLP
jgi:hypothetical protein